MTNKVGGPIYEPLAVTCNPSSVQGGGQSQCTVLMNGTVSGSQVVNLTYTAVDSQGSPVAVSSVLSSPPATVTVTNSNSGAVTLTANSGSPAATVTVTANGMVNGSLVVTV